MDNLKKILITTLRDKNSTRAQFQEAAHQLAHVLAQQAAEHLSIQEIDIQTPLVQTTGVKLERAPMLLPILRSGIALLPAFQSYFPGAAIGIVGLQRDETTAQASMYYENIPPLKPDDQIIILDPMLATGGTAVETVKLLIEKGAQQKNIIFVAIVSAPEGLENLQSHFPKVKVLIAVEDEKLNSDKFILPGLGDFGDRYFGSE